MHLPPLHAWSWPEPVAATPAAGGLINQTWWVQGLQARHAVIQRLNTDIFVPEVHHDIEAITAHLAAKGLATPRLLRTTAGELWASDGGIYRALTLVGDRTVDRLEGPDRLRLAHDGARLVGQAHLALADLDLEFQSIRPGVHDTDTHFATLRTALAAHATHRLHGRIGSLGAELAERWASWDGPRDLPIRIIHGDLKISNLRFAGDRAIALIDLDTWQHGTLDAELGDAMRSWCNTSGEDDTEARIDVDVFAAAMKGYAEGAPGFATEAEGHGMAAGLERIALELAMRFAADALNESYFGFDPTIGRGEHNALRAEGQLALARAARTSRPDLDAAVAAART